MDAFLNNNLTQLCFNRSEFNRTDFNVEIFLNSLRRRATIEQIQNDLRLFLKILQNAMIELINEDYADFVNLSSNLVNLRSTVEKLHGDLGEISGDFNSSTSNLAAAVDQLSVDLEEKIKCRKEQRKLEEQIRLYSLLQKLDNLISNFTGDPAVSQIERVGQLLTTINFCLENQLTPQDALFMATFHSLVNSYQHVLDVMLVAGFKEHHLTKFLTVLFGYEACQRRDAALAVYIAEFLENSIRKSVMGKRSASPELLDAVFSCLHNEAKANEEFLRPKVGVIETSCQNRVENGSLFLDDCLLTVLLGVLDRDLGSVLIPTDAQTFHSCYTALIDFIRKWPSRSNLLKIAADKFSLRIYFQLRCHEVEQMIEESLNSSNIESVHSSSRFHNKTSLVVYDALMRLWSDEVYLIPLVPKLWDFTCKLINRHTEWIKKVASLQSLVAANSSLQINGQIVENGGESTSDWRIGILLLTDIHLFDAAIFDFAFDCIWPKLRALGSDTAIFGQCLSSAGSQLKLEGNQVRTMAVDRLSSEIGSHLTSVNEVPRQYRWTRKEAPTKHSVYVSSALSTLQGLKTLAESSLLPVDQTISVFNETLSAVMAPYMENVRNVLISVDKMSSSLSRLKKSAKSGANPGPDGMTDDQKIRLQISLDLAEFRSSVDSLTESLEFVADWTVLNELEMMAKNEKDASPAVG